MKMYVSPVLSLKIGNEEVDQFVYLGASVNNKEGTDCDIRARIGKARVVFNNLGKVRKSSQYGRKTKSRIYLSNVVSVLLYGCETWRMTTKDEKLLDTFHHKCLRRILKIYWPV